MIIGNTLQKQLRQMSSIGSFHKQLSEMNSIGSIHKQFSQMNSIGSLHKQLSQMNSIGSIHKQFGQMNSIGSLHKQLSQMNSIGSIHKQFSQMNSLGSLHKQISSINIGSISKLSISSLNQNQAFNNSIMALAQPGYFETAISALNEQTLDFETFEEDFEAQVIKDDLEGISSSNSTKSFNDYFEKLPAYVQFIMIYIFMQIITPQINSISANLLTPHVESFLSSSQSEDRIKIKSIKEIAYQTTIETNSLRFITGNNVRLRSDSSTNSNILDELQLGQIVTILSKEKNWVEVQYSYVNGEFMQGWVFTRYTSRFKK